MPTIRKTRGIRAHLSPRHKGPVDAGGYTPEPRDLPDPALLKTSAAKDDPFLRKALTDPRGKSENKPGPRRVKLNAACAI